MSSGESFAELFEASLRSEKRAVAKRDPDVGELVQGEIVQIGTEYAFLDIGGKSEAMISLDELRGEDGELTVHVGDTLEGHVIGSVGKDGGLLISGRIQKGAGLSDQIRQAYSQGTPVQGLVTGVNKGGLDVDLGGVRAFLPSSQIELRYCQDPSIYLGKALALRVSRISEESRQVIVSRRAVLEIEQRALSDESRARLKIGERYTGTIVAMQEPAALVDIGGLDGNVPTSELYQAARTAGRDENSIKIGQRVDVEVVRLEEVRPGHDHLHHSFQGNLRIGLSLKGLLADPMAEALSTLSEGERVRGRVVRLEPFGAFVEIRTGVEALIHISLMAERHITHPREILQLGQELTATVVSLDRERRRIGLSLIEEARAAQAQVAQMLKAGDRMKARIERVEGNGLIVRVMVPDVLPTTYPRGLIPNAEVGVPRGTDLKKLFQIGREVLAVVMSVDGEGRVRLSIRQLTEAPAVPVAEAPSADKPVEAVVAAIAPEVPVAAASEASTATPKTKAKTTRTKKAKATDEAPAASVETPASTEPAAEADKAPAKKTTRAKKKTEEVAAPVVAATEPVAAAEVKAPKAKSATSTKRVKAAVAVEPVPVAAEPAPASAEPAPAAKKRVRKSA
ncbi:MAG: S1 RNA-binding domain-containing protein [Myxococcales bacterium]|nr:S1 RNA-binding domain-containing protein [Myxococcales bacterium]